MKNNKLKINNSGFSLVEVVVASAIIVTAFLAFASVSVQAVTASQKILHKTQSAYLLNEASDAVKAIRDIGWTSNIANLTNGTTYYLSWNGTRWTLTTTPSTIGKFTRTVIFSAVNRDSTTKDIVTSGGTLDTGTRKVTLNISYSDNGVAVNKTLYLYLTNLFGN